MHEEVPRTAFCCMNELPPVNAPIDPLTRKFPWHTVVIGSAVLVLVVAGLLAWQFVPVVPVSEGVQTEDASKTEASALVDLYVVGVKKEVSLENAYQTVVSLGIKVKYGLQLSHVLIVELDAAQLQKLKQDPSVTWVELQREYKLLQNSLLLADLVLAGTPASGAGRDAVDVFIIDTGAGKDSSLNYTSRSGIRYLFGTGVVDTNVYDVIGHGTAVATAFTETMARSEHSASVHMHSIGVTVGGSDRVSDDVLAEAVNKAVLEGAEVINISFGGSSEPSTVLKNALTEANKAGVALVVAAGNEGDTMPNGMTSDPAIISVGALKNDGTVASYSNGFLSGFEADVFALGEVNGHEGTSYASPRVAALIAGIIATPIDTTYDKNGDGEWNPNEAEERLRDGIQSQEYTLVRENDGVTALLVPTTGAGIDTNTGNPSNMTPVIASDITSDTNPGLSQSAIENSSSDTTSDPSSSATPLAHASANDKRIVPCEGLDCDLCSVGDLMQNIINFLLAISIPIAAVMFAYAGALYMSAGGNPTQIGKAQKIFKSVGIGFLIAITGWLVVQTILSTVFDDDFWIGGNWNELECVAESKRLMNTSISDLLNEVLGSGGGEFTVVDPGTTQNGCTTDSSLCTYISTLRFSLKNGGIINKEYNDKLNAFGTALNSSIGVTVTEACPNTSSHQNQCHAQCLCTDIAISDMGNVSSLNQVFQAAQ